MLRHHSSCATLSLGVFVFNRFFIFAGGRILLHSSRVIVYDILVDESLWIGAVGNFVVEFVLEHVLLEL